MGVCCEAPTFAGVRELLQQMEILKVVYKASPRFPRELDNLVSDNSDPFAEKLRLEIDALKNSSSF